jgi:hypothetical protein
LIVRLVATRECRVIVSREGRERNALATAAKKMNAMLDARRRRRSVAKVNPTQKQFFLTCAASKSKFHQ